MRRQAVADFGAIHANVPLLDAHFTLAHKLLCSWLRLSQGKATTTDARIAIPVISPPWGQTKLGIFEDYLIRLLEERDRVGLTDMIREIDAIMITVDPGHSIRYVSDLALMTPYHYLVTLESESHWTHILRIDMQSPDFLVREVKDPDIRGIFRSLNEVYPIGARKPNSRYMGEILRVEDLHSVVAHQEERGFRFFSQDQIRRLELPGNLAVGKPSPYTHNIVAYMERSPDQARVYALGMSSIRDDVQEAFRNAKDLQNQLGIADLILPSIISPPGSTVRTARS